LPTPAQHITSDNHHLSDPIRSQQKPDPNTPLDPSFAALDATLRELLSAVTAPNTRRAYAGDLDHFLRWGGLVPASPLCVARYLAAHADRNARPPRRCHRPRPCGPPLP